MAKKKIKDLFNDPVEAKSQDFASLFESSSMSPTSRLKVGDQFRGEILSIGRSESFISTGTPRDAVILNTDLVDENNQLKYKVGDFIDAIVLRVSGDEIRVTRKGAKSAPVDFDSLEDAFDMELPVVGKVTEAINGGYRVVIQGQQAFCPISQLGVPYGANPQDYVGKKFEFLITQFEPKKRNIVVSRRKLLELQRAENEGEWMQKHQVGDIVEGRVSRTEQFGAFVDLGGGVEGLVHISEIGFTRLKHASEAVHVGDPVQVKILKIEEEEKRLKISLSIKQGGGVRDPWVEAVQKFAVGTVVDGIVDKKEAFGLFISLGGGINGLLPKSKWRDSEDAKKYEQAKKGDPIKVRIDELKYEERKISLGLPGEVDDDSWRAHQTSNSALSGVFAAAFAKAQEKSKR